MKDRNFILHRGTASALPILPDLAGHRYPYSGRPSDGKTLFYDSPSIRCPANISARSASMTMKPQDQSKLTADLPFSLRTCLSVVVIPTGSRPARPSTINRQDSGFGVLDRHRSLPRRRELQESSRGIFFLSSSRLGNDVEVDRSEGKAHCNFLLPLRRHDFFRADRKDFGGRTVDRARQTERCRQVPTESKYHIPFSSL